MLGVILAMIAAGLAFAGDDAKPVVGPGATKDDVIKAYGWPNGQSQSGAKEILSYAQGEVILENGRVDRVNFSPNVPWQAPKPRPAPATASTRKVAEPAVDYWLTDFHQAESEAERRHARILALFTGSDWSPASQQFHTDVEYQPDFVNAFAGSFVFLKLDFPRGNPVPAKISDENIALRDRYDVTTYPTLLILSADGDLLARADLTKSVAGESFRERVIAAVRDAEIAAGDMPAVGHPAAPPPAIAPTIAAPVAPPPAVPKPTEPRPFGRSPAAPAILTAVQMVVLALMIGALVVAFVLWRLWKQPKRNAGNVEEHAERIDAAAGGLPVRSEICGWTHEKLRAVLAELAEFDSYFVTQRPAGSEIDLELRRTGDTAPRVLVCCAPGAQGSVGPKPLRELFGTMAAEGAELGWFVSPVGFTADAHSYAAAHRIVLVGLDGLHNLMREVPPVSLPAILART